MLEQYGGWIIAVATAISTSVAFLRRKVAAVEFRYDREQKRVKITFLISFVTPKQ